MILIESLKDYIEVTPQEKFIELATKIYITTDFINNGTLPNNYQE